MRNIQIIATILLVLGEGMLFAANRYDPINASVLMLAMLLFALGNVRFMFVAYAPASTKLGAFLTITGYFLSALFFFDVMGFGISEHSSHFHKKLFWFPQLLLIGGMCFLTLWFRQRSKLDALPGVTMAVALVLYSGTRYFEFASLLQLIGGIALAGAAVWIAFYKLEKY